MDAIDEIMDEVMRQPEPSTETEVPTPEEQKASREALFEKLEKGGSDITKGDIERARTYQIADAASEAWIEQHDSEPTTEQLEEFIEETMPNEGKQIDADLVTEVKEAFTKQFGQEPNNEELADSLSIQIENDNKDPAEWTKEVQEKIQKELEVFKSREIFDIAAVERQTAKEAYKDLNGGTEPTTAQLDEFIKDLAVPDMPAQTEVKELTVAGNELEEFIQEYMAENEGKEPSAEQLENFLNEQGPKFAMGGETEEVIVEPTEAEKEQGVDVIKEVFGKEPEEKEIDEYLKEFGIGEEAGRETTEEMKQGELDEREPTEDEGEIVRQEIQNELLKQLNPDMREGEADELLKELMDPLNEIPASEASDPSKIERDWTISEQVDDLQEFIKPMVTPDENNSVLPPNLAHLDKDDIKWYIKDFVKQNGRKPDKYELTDYMTVKELEGREYFGMTESTRDHPEFLYPTSDTGSQLGTDADQGIFTSMNVAILAGVLALLGVVSYIRRNSSASQKFTRIDI